MCLTLCYPMDCSLPGSSVHGILQARNLGCHAHLWEIFPTQGLNQGLPHCRQILYHLSYQRMSLLFNLGFCWNHLGSLNTHHWVPLLWSSSLPWSLYDRPMNQKRGVEAKNMTLLRKLTDQEDCRLLSQNNSLIGIRMPFF